jgi:hypothetical protein
VNLSYDKVTRVLARALAKTPDELRAAFAPAQQSEFDLIVQFRQQNMNGHIKWDDAAYLRWRYAFVSGENSVSDKKNRLWRVKIDDQILAIIGVDYAEFYVSGEIEDWRNPLDLLVRSDVDGLGLGVWMSLVLEQEYPRLFAMGATRHSQGIVKKLFTPMPDMGAWKLILNTQTLIARRFSNSIISWLLSRSLNVYLKLVLRFKLLSTASEVEIKPIQDFSSYQDDLNELHASYKPSGQRLHHRSSDFLYWRFINNPRRSYHCIGAFVQGKLVGYAVYHKSPRAHLEIDDIFVAEKDTQNLTAIISALVNFAYQENLPIISFIAHQHLLALPLKNIGFRWRDDGHLFSIYLNKDQSESSTQIENWYLTSIDTHSEGF